MNKKLLPAGASCFARVDSWSSIISLLIRSLHHSASRPGPLNPIYHLQLFLFHPGVLASSVITLKPPHPRFLLNLLCFSPPCLNMDSNVFTNNSVVTLETDKDSPRSTEFRPAIKGNIYDSICCLLCRASVNPMDLHKQRYPNQHQS